jgi:hypothetical protein
MIFMARLQTPNNKFAMLAIRGAQLATIPTRDWPFLREALIRTFADFVCLLLQIQIPLPGIPPKNSLHHSDKSLKIWLAFWTNPRKLCS